MLSLRQGQFPSHEFSFQYLLLLLYTLLVFYQYRLYFTSYYVSCEFEPHKRLSLFP